MTTHICWFAFTDSIADDAKKHRQDVMKKQEELTDEVNELFRRD